ncbi:MAG: zinc ribbon domain-containing protein [Deltaproteobacteria bacterium]
MTTTTKPSRIADRALIAVEALVGIAVVAAIVGKSYGAAPTVVFVICGGAAAFTAYSVIRMLGSLSDRTLDVSGRVEDERRAALEHEKLLLLQGIKELEADYAIGKVAPEDYQHLRSSAEKRALAIIDQLRDEDAVWHEQAQRLVEKRVGKVRAVVPEGAAAPEASTEAWLLEDRATRDAREALRALFDDTPSAFANDVCGACETENDADAKFCVGCGRPKQEAA